MKNLISLKVDYAFKLIFGKEGNEAILMAFLNAALKMPTDNPINQITLLNPEINKEYDRDKKSVLDIRAVTNGGMQINIEIQLSDRYDMEKRSLYYWAKLYAQPLNERMSYRDLAKTVAINILDFNYLKQTNNYHSVFRLYEESDKFLLTDACELHFIELPKLLIRWKHHEAHPWENSLERWLLLLESANNEAILTTLEGIAMQDTALQQAMQAWETLSNDPKVREEYFSRHKALLDESAALREAEYRGRDKGLAEGWDKGLAEGWNKGLAEANFATARAMIAKGLSDELIAEITHLTLEQIETLKQPTSN